MFVNNFGVVVISPNSFLLEDLFSCKTEKGLVALATISSIGDMDLNLHYLRPEIIIVDDDFTGISAERIVHRLRINECSREFARAVIFVLSEKTDPFYQQKCISGGTDYYMLKPVMAEALWDRVHLFIRSRIAEQSGMANEGSRHKSEKEEITEQTITEFLYSLNFSPKTKGFAYLLDAVFITVNNFVHISLQGSELYNALAEKHQVSSDLIRHCIHEVLVKMNPADVEKYIKKHNLTAPFDYGSKPLSTGINFIIFASYVVTARLNERFGTNNDKNKKKNSCSHSGRK